MRTMRVAMVLAAVATSLMAAPLSAQGQGGGRPGGQGGPGGDPSAMQARQNEMLFQGITLSAEQKTKVDSIQTAARAAQQAAMQGGGMQDPAARERMRTQRQATMTAIRGVLTPEQQTKFDANLAAMPAGGRGQGGRPPRR